MNRRDLIAFLGSTAVSWPLGARAQQQERVRRIGVLMLYPQSDPQGQLRATAFRQGLEKLGWTVGRNLQIDFQWGLGRRRLDTIRRRAVAAIGAGLDPGQRRRGNEDSAAIDTHGSHHLHRGQ
jgi:hypothetical protein